MGVRITDIIETAVIAEGSTHGIKIETRGADVFISQLNASNANRWVRIHNDDLPELIKELERISKGENV